MFRSKDMTQASFQEQGNSKKRKRNRETLSCYQCRDRKIACDRQRPCSNCVRFKRDISCQYAAEAGTQPESNGISKQDESSAGKVTSPVYASPASTRDPVEERIARIEQQITTYASSRANSVADTPPSWRKPSDASIMQTQGMGVSDNIFSRGRLAMKPTMRPYYIGATAWSIAGPFDVFSDHQVNFRQTLMPQWKRFARVSSVFTTQPHDTILNLIPTSPPADLFSHIQKMIPSDAECEVLVGRFLDSANEVYPIVSREQFMTEVATFFQDKWNVNPYWLGLFVAVLAIGYSVPITPSTDGTWMVRTELTKELTSLAQQQALTTSASTHRPPIVTFQTLLALIVAKHFSFGWSDANNPNSGLLGLANRMVFTLGLHHDPSTSRRTVSPEECDLRRKIFATYLYCEVDHCMRTGTPLVMRANDFDVQEPSTTNNMHQVFFFRKYDLFSAALEITHSSKVRPSIEKVAEILKGLGSAAETLRTTLNLDQKSANSTSDTVRLSLLAILINRLHESLLILILEHGTAATRSQYTSDLMAPATEIVELTTSLRKSLETLVQPKAVFGWNIFILAQIRITLYSAVSFQLVFLQKSLMDQSLLALRGSTPDSSVVFRKLRALLRYTALSSTLSRIGIKEQCGFASYLRNVEERFRLFVEQGTTEIDLNSEAGLPVLEAIGRAMDEELEQLDKMLKETENIPQTVVQEPTPATNDVDSIVDWSADIDPAILEGFDMPWTDVMLEPSWPLQSGQMLTDPTRYS